MSSGLARLCSWLVITTWDGHGRRNRRLLGVAGRAHKLPHGGGWAPKWPGRVRPRTAARRGLRRCRGHGRAEPSRACPWALDHAAPPSGRRARRPLRRSASRWARAAWRAERCGIGSLGRASRRRHERGLGCARGPCPSALRGQAPGERTMSAAHECPRRRPGERAVARQDGCMQLIFGAVLATLATMHGRAPCMRVRVVGRPDPYPNQTTCNMRGRSSCARPCAAKAVQLSLAQRTRSIVAR